MISGKALAGGKSGPASAIQLLQHLLQNRGRKLWDNADHVIVQRHIIDPGICLVGSVFQHLGAPEENVPALIFRHGGDLPTLGKNASQQRKKFFGRLSVQEFHIRAKCAFHQIGIAQQAVVEARATMSAFAWLRPRCPGQRIDPLRFSDAARTSDNVRTWFNAIFFV